MCQTEPPRVIDLTARLRRARRRERAYILLALWTQYLSLGVLALYGILRAVCAAARRWVDTAGRWRCCGPFPMACCWSAG